MMRILNLYDPKSTFTLKAMDKDGIVLFIGYFREKESAKLAFSFCQKVDSEVVFGKINSLYTEETL